MEYLVVDGYNVIHSNSWKDKFDLRKKSLEECRDELLKILSNYQGYKKNEILVIFDAYNVKCNKQIVSVYDNLSVVYTKENETADNFIEKFIYNSADNNVIRVVTSDYLEQTMVLRLGGVRMTPEELKADIKRIKKKSKKHSGKGIHETNTIMSNVDKELLRKLDKMRKNNF